VRALSIFQVGEVLARVVGWPPGSNAAGSDGVRPSCRTGGWKLGGARRMNGDGGKPWGGAVGTLGIEGGILGFIAGSASVF